LLFISDPLTEKLIARMLSWKSNADESEGLTTHFPWLPRDGHQLATANLVGQKPPGACHELNEEQHIAQNRDVDGFWLPCVPQRTKRINLKR